MKKAFTLIELIVAISIVAVIASAVSVRVLDNLKTSRDARRKVDLRSIQTALEFYKQQNGAYPIWIWPQQPYPVPQVLVPVFLTSSPNDPNPGFLGSSGYGQSTYHYTSDGNRYAIAAFQESLDPNAPLPAPQLNYLGDGFCYDPNGGVPNGGNNPIQVYIGGYCLLRSSGSTGTPVVVIYQVSSGK